MTANNKTEDPAMARKRRIELRSSSRSDDDSASLSHESKRARYEQDDYDSETGERRVPSLRGIKKQTRYEPGVPMTKEELAAWRKEARRVRNRESAAASRHKTKERIEVLENEVATLQSKYDAALRRIAELEGQEKATVAAVAPQAPSSFVSLVPPPRVSPQCSPKISPSPSPLIMHDSVSLGDLSDVNLHQAASQMLLPSVDIHPSMIPRPTAVCV